MLGLFLFIMFATTVAYLVRCYIRGRRRLARRGIRSAARALEIPRGDDECRIYTYDGEPIKRRRSGDVFSVIVLPGRRGMTSVYTGMQWTGRCCLSYGSQKIGFISDYDDRFDMLARLADRHDTVTVDVVVTGYDQRLGYPKLVALLPSIDWFERALAE